jgi:FAD:protein FMN transferase
MKKVLQIGVLIIMSVLAFVWLRKRPQPIEIPREEIWPVMGTIASLKTPASERENFPHMLEITKETFYDFNEKLSVYRPDSELSRLNSKGSIAPASESTREFLTITVEMTQRAQGFFDTTLLPVIRLWGFSGGMHPDAIPSPEKIRQALHRTPITDLVIDESGVRFPHSPGNIDPGGIAKGIALDRAFSRLQAEFPNADFLLNLGGEIRVQGQATPSRPWRIAVQHPFDKNATIGALILPSSFAVATSGHYERYIEIDGKRYAHIIDPETGWPVTGTAGVTVLCPNGTEADVLSTALFVAGIDRAPKLLGAFPSSAALLVPDREPLEIHLSENMQPWFEPLPQYKSSVRRLPPTP